MSKNSTSSIRSNPNRRNVNTVTRYQPLYKQRGYFRFDRFTCQSVAVPRIICVSIREAVRRVADRVVKSHARWTQRPTRGSAGGDNSRRFHFYHPINIRHTRLDLQPPANFYANLIDQSVTR